MLTKEILNNFSKEANKWWYQFCVWMYANNYFAEYQKNKKEPKFYAENPNYFKNPSSWEIITHDVIIPSLQHWCILSVARLVDTPFFKENPNKKNLSIYYIIELLEDDDIKLDIKNGLDQQQWFIKWVKELRNKFLTHNDMGEKNKTIPAGIEKFFENLNDIVWKIKEKYPNLKDCNDLNLSYTDKLSKAGVEEIFEKIK